MPRKQAKDTTPRRSARLTIYDSNGRDALASTLGWTRAQLESWLASATVRPHLRLWYRTCLENERRYNEGIEWINTGEKGYYYNPSDLEEDVLLECLGEGFADSCETDEKLGAMAVGFATEAIKTGAWTTVELWARTAWRIVQANMGKDQVFENAALKHPAACYAFVIDLLCIAFHSIAHRGAASCYRDLIIGSTVQELLAWNHGREFWVKEHGWEDEPEVEAGVEVESDEEDEESSSSEGCSDVSMGYGSSDLQKTLAGAEESKIFSIAEEEDDDDDDAATVSCIVVATCIPATLAALKEEKANAAKLRANHRQGDYKMAVEKWLGIEAEGRGAEDMSDKSEDGSEDKAQSIIGSSELTTVILNDGEVTRSSNGKDVVMQDVLFATPERRKYGCSGGKGEVAMLTPPFSG